MAGLAAVALLCLLGPSPALAGEFDGCPKAKYTGPGSPKPRDCPAWSEAPTEANKNGQNWRTAPERRGDERDDECLVGGLVGGDFFNPCYEPNMKSMSVMNALRKGGADGGGTARAKQEWTGGTGPYKAWYTTDPTLLNHTIYAPKAPTGKKMPVILWTNGACSMNGAGFSNFLTEIASHGFMILARGNPKQKWGVDTPNYAATLMGASSGEKSRVKMGKKAFDWVKSGSAGGKYGVGDHDRLAVAGQSCGGVEAYSYAVTDARVKAVAIYNTGVIDPTRRHYLRALRRPVGYFYGGDTDFSQKYIEEDYKTSIPDSLPAMMSVLQTGHYGTFFEPHGGKYGKISVAWWKWILMDDQASKAMFFNQSSSLYQDKWKIRTSHWRDVSPTMKEQEAKEARKRTQMPIGAHSRRGQ